MPGVVLFKRRWEFASDDLVFPGIFEIFIRTAWLVLIAVIFYINRSTLDCTGGHLLKTYYVGTLVLLSISLVLDFIMVYTSMQGTMTNVRPRRRIPYLIYIKMGIGIPELAWTVIGTYWAFGMSYGCDWEVVAAVKAAAICGWIAFFFVIISATVLFDPLGRKKVLQQCRSEQQFQRSSDGEQFMAGAASAATRVWETRCKILCCCVGCDEQSRTAFTDIAKLMSMFFQDVDLVPTDIGAGLILLHRQQQLTQSSLTGVVVEHTDSSSSHPNYQSTGVSTGTTNTLHSNSLGHLETSASSFVSLDSLIPSMQASGEPCSPLKDWMTIPMMTHYMKYAMASYGWPLFMFTNLFTGICKLYPHCRCCNCLLSSEEIIQDNTCQCHTAAIKKFVGISGEDLLYASFHNRIYEIPFFVSIDREKNAVVVSIRGTLSLKDALTDLTAECDSLTIEGLSDCYAHKGILSAARFILRELERLQLLEKAFSMGQDLELVICGHSLGAGAAVLLATLLRPKYPNIRCFAYSPPGGLLSPSASQYSQEFVCSVVLGKDFIPRLSLITIEDLKMKLLQAIQDCDIPKYRVLLGGCWQAMFGVKISDKPGEAHSSPDPSRPLIEETSSVAASYSVASGSAEAIREAVMSSGRSRITQPPLLPPGQILHIIEVESSKSWCGTPRYSAVWSCQQVFDEILVSPEMFSDHLPDAVMRALDQLNSRHFSPVSLRSRSRVQQL